MAINIKNATAEELARELAEATGESLTDAIIGALRSRLAAIQTRRVRPELWSEVEQIQALVRSQPDRDRRNAEEILGFDEFGLPT